MPYRRFWYRLAAFMSGYGIEQLAPSNLNLSQVLQLGLVFSLHQQAFEAYVRDSHRKNETKTLISKTASTTQ
jgi:hypothetical protein